MTYVSLACELVSKGQASATQGMTESVLTLLASQLHAYIVLHIYQSMFVPRFTAEVSLSVSSESKRV